MPFLQEVADFLKAEIKPAAQRLDHDREALRGAFLRLGAHGWLALRRPGAYGGPQLPEEEFRAFQVELARTSGALAFLQTQHQSAVSMLAKSENETLKETYLPHMHDGGKCVGIGFSQLRRPGPPTMRAEPVEGGYRLDGLVPWVTGWSFFPEFLIGATLPDGQAVFGIVPLITGDGVTVSSPMRLAAMESAMTVTAELSGYFLPAAQVAFVRPSGWIQANDQINITLQGHFAIGCALAGLDVLADNAQKKKLDFLAKAYEALSREVEMCRAAMARSDDPEDERLRTRAWGIDLAVRCAHAAVASSSGAANSSDHPAQRVLREALVFTVSAQTAPIMRETLARLCR